MTAIDVREFTDRGWIDPERADERARWHTERLEEGNILVFRRAPFILRDEDRQTLLRVRQAGSSYVKNVSYRPDTDDVRGMARDTADTDAVRRCLRTFSRTVQDFIAAFLSPYRGGIDVEFASYRPFEEHGRRLSLKARNDLLHVDSFPTRPMNGRRILRVFTNINPSGTRVWETTDTFDVLAPRFARDVGLERIATAARSASGRARRAIVRAARSVGLPVVDRPPYDVFMLACHHAMKANRTFQSDTPRSRWEFAPGTTWMVYTDMVPHAVMSGQYALEQTFLVRPDVLLLPERSPLRVLERLCGARLTL